MDFFNSTLTVSPTRAQPARTWSEPSPSPNQMPHPHPHPNQVRNLGGVGPDTDAEPWLYYEAIGTLYGGQVHLVYLLW
jgi:hypothetical protein